MQNFSILRHLVGEILYFEFNAYRVTLPGASDLKRFVGGVQLCPNWIAIVFQTAYIWCSCWVPLMQLHIYDNCSVALRLTTNTNLLNNIYSTPINDVLRLIPKQWNSKRGCHSTWNAVENQRSDMRSILAICLWSYLCAVGNTEASSMLFYIMAGLVLVWKLCSCMFR